MLKRKIAEVFDNVQDAPDDSGGPWHEGEIRGLMAGKGWAVIMGWSYHEWYVALLEYRLQRLVNGGKI